MRIPTQLGQFVGGTATLALLAGCAGGGGSTPSTMAGSNAGAAGQSISHTIFRPLVKRTDGVRGVVRPPIGELTFGDPNPLDAKAPKSGVYVGQFGAGTASLYALPDSTNKAPVCVAAATAVNGLGTNTSGVTYIPAVQNGTAEVLTFGKNSCTPGKTTLTNPGGQPSDVAFTTTGTIYVLNIVNSTSGTGSIAVYPKGKTSPSAQLTPPGITGYGLGIATDSKNNVYVSYDGGSGSEIAVFKGGKGTGTVLQNSSDISIGLTFDDKKNLLAANASAAVVDVFKPPYTGSPTTITQKGEPVDLKLDVAQKNLYVGDYANGTLDVFKYPSGTYEYSVSNGLSQSNIVEGVSVDPSDNN